MKTGFLASCTLIAAAVAGDLGRVSMTTGSSACAFVALAIAVAAIVFMQLTLASVHAALSRRMVNDLRDIEFLLDRKEFDHV